MQTTIRLAHPADLEALVHLGVAFRQHQQQSTPSESEFRTAFALLLADGATDLFLAHRGTNQALGYVQSRYRYCAWVPGPAAELEDVFVLAEARRQGIGRGLIAFALARAEARGCRLVSLTTNERNRDGLALYASFGFRAERQRWNGGRALWLERWLDSQ